MLQVLPIETSGEELWNKEILQDSELLLFGVGVVQSTFKDLFDHDRLVEIYDQIVATLVNLGIFATVAAEASTFNLKLALINELLNSRLLEHVASDLRVLIIEDEHGCQD